MVVSMLTALDHVILAVNDLDSASRDYRALLGLAPSWHGEHPGSGTSNVLFRVDNTYLELLAPSGSGPIGDGLRSILEHRGEGLVGLAFATEDLDACCRTLSERGLEPGAIERGAGRDRPTGAERRWRRAPLSPASTRGVVLFPIQHESPADELPRAVASGAPGSAVHALDHAVVQTTDSEATRKLYGDTLGLRLALDREFPDWGVRLMFFRVGGVTLEVAGVLAGADAGGALPGATMPDPGADRLYGLSWRVRNADAARERLVQAGIDVSEIRTGRRPGTRVFTVRSGTRGVPTLVLELDREREQP